MQTVVDRAAQNRMRGSRLRIHATQRRLVPFQSRLCATRFGWSRTEPSAEISTSDSCHPLAGSAVLLRILSGECQVGLGYTGYTDPNFECSHPVLGGAVLARASSN